MALSGGAQGNMPSWSDWMASEGINLEVSPITSPLPKPVARAPVVRQLSEDEKEKQRKRKEEDNERRKQMRALMKQGRDSKPEQDKGNAKSNTFEVHASSPPQKKVKANVEPVTENNQKENGNLMTPAKSNKRPFEESKSVSTATSSAKKMSAKMSSPTTLPVLPPSASSVVKKPKQSPIGATPSKTKLRQSPKMASPPKSTISAPINPTPSSVVAQEIPSATSVPQPINVAPIVSMNTNPANTTTTSTAKPTASEPNVAKTLFQKQPKQRETTKVESNDKGLESSKQELFMKIQEGINVYQTQLLQNISMYFQKRKIYSVTNEIETSKHSDKEYQEMETKLREKDLEMEAWKTKFLLLDSKYKALEQKSKAQQEENEDLSALCEKIIGKLEMDIPKPEKK